MKKLLTLFVCLAASAAAQDYTTTYEATLSGAVGAVTLQMPASDAEGNPTRNVRMNGAYVYCSTDCTIQVDRNGTAATATAGTAVTVNPENRAATAKVFTASNVGTGTTIGKYKITGGGSIVLDLRAVWMTGNYPAQNTTIKTASMTGSVSVVMYWREEEIAR